VREGGLLHVLANGERGEWQTEYVQTEVCHAGMRGLSRFWR